MEATSEEKKKIVVYDINQYLDKQENLPQRPKLLPSKNSD